MSVEVIKTSVAVLGEGPHWDEKEQCLLFVDIIGGTFNKWSSITGNISSVKKGAVVLSIYLE